VNLRAKTAALLAIIVTAVLITANLFWLRYAEESLKQTIFKGVDSQAKTAAQGIETFVDDCLLEAAAVARTLPVKALLKENTSEIAAHFREMFNIFTKFQNGIFLLDNKGKFIADYPYHPELHGQSFAFREYFKRTMQDKQGVVGSPYKSKRTGSPVLTFTAPVLDENGHIIAVVACSVDLLSKNALGGYRKQTFGTTGYLFVFDNSRLLILHPEPDRLLTYVQEGKNQIMEAAIKGFEGGGESVNFQGVPTLLSVRQVPVARWIVAVQVTQEEAYAPVTNMRKRMLIISSFAVLLVIVLGIVVVHRVTRPLTQLERVASQICTDLEDAEKRYSYTLADASMDGLKEIRSRDEIGLLTSSFLRLTTKLKQTIGSLQRSTEDWERTFNAVHEAVLTLDLDSRILKMNQTAENWFRTSLQKVQGQQAYRVILGTEAPPADWPNIALLMKHQKIRWTQDLAKPYGVFEFTITPLTTAAGTAGAVLVISDITERVETEEHIREMAFYDQLTGLPNRFLLQDRIQQAIAASSRSGKKTSIMFIDLDHFKDINDLCGHDAGDEVLKKVAGLISVCLRKNDTLSRIGGDEFVVVLQDIDRMQEAAAIAQRIIEIRSIPLIIQDNTLAISSSIGVAFYPDDGEDSRTLLKNADAAMYRAKDGGRSNYQYFSQSHKKPDKSSEHK
jgi:diguanylate cyclase (GGDEF)-like protein